MLHWVLKTLPAETCASIGAAVQQQRSSLVYAVLQPSLPSGHLPSEIRCEIEVGYPPNLCAIGFSPVGELALDGFQFGDDA